MSRVPTLPRVDLKNRLLLKVVQLLREDVRRHHGSVLTFEQQSDYMFEALGSALWMDEELRLRELATSAVEVEVEDKRYRRLDQPSSGEYCGRWGTHHVEEPLYRQAGVHNGPTVKPIELRVGIVENMTPDLARIVGELSAEQTSRQVVTTLKAVGMAAPSRAALEKHAKRMASDMGSQIAQLEEAARGGTALPAKVASVSCGMDRGAVRMVEPLEAGTAPPRERATPYERTPPPPGELHYRMAWNGSTTVYDRQGKPLHTWRYAEEADADSVAVARRVCADVAWVLRRFPDIPVQCIQDAGPELRVLPEQLRRTLPANTDVELIELVDFEHLMGYLVDVVDACEPEGDPENWKMWYRWELTHDDGAIDRIWRKLKELAKKLPRGASKKRKAVAAALTYIRTRKKRMRYASLRERNLTIGSGDTENTVWLMQERVKRAGQSWQPRGLRGILVLRGLVLSDRWDTAWEAYAATHRKEVRCAA